MQADVNINSDRGSGSQSEAQLTPDRQYRIDDSEMGLLGSGAHGTVRIAQNVITGEYVAVKIMPTSVIRTACKEVMALTRLNDPHVVQLLSIQVDVNLERVYVVMELCQGGELFDRIAECGGLDELEAKRYFGQILSALHHCHQNQVYHRDLKPENVLLDAEDNAKVADFGLAAVFQHVSEDATFLRHTKVGSVMYAAPEVLTATAGVGYDASRADMSSLGIILFSMLSGTLPFQCAAATRCKRYAAVLQQGIQVMCPQHLSPFVTSLLSRMLDPDPSRRYTPMEALKCEWFSDSIPLHMPALSEAPATRTWTVSMLVSQPPSPRKGSSAADGGGMDLGGEQGSFRAGVTLRGASSAGQPTGSTGLTPQTDTPLGKRAREAADEDKPSRDHPSQSQQQGEAASASVAAAGGAGAVASCASSTGGAGRAGDEASTSLQGSAATSRCGGVAASQPPAHSASRTALRECPPDDVAQLGFGHLPPGTEQLLREIVHSLRYMGLQYTVEEEAEKDVFRATSVTSNADERQQLFQRITVRIRFSTQRSAAERRTG